MSILISTKNRSDQEEIMDDLDYKGPILHDSLDKLAKINQWLGGNVVTVNGLKNLLKEHDRSIPLRIVDLGCGGGDILREVSRFGKQNAYNFHLIGIDANKHTIAYAQECSSTYDNIEFKTMDVFSEAFKELNYDVVLSTLFLHHFKEKELITFLESISKKASLGIVVNDLHRHKLAYYLFKLLALTIRNQTIVQDGLTSVLRGFKRHELESISIQINTPYTLKWKWAFRFQWILKTSNL